MVRTVGQDTLLHGETLFVVSSSDAEEVSLPLISEQIGLNFSAHALLVEDAQLVLIVYLEQLLGSRSGIRYVQLK